MYGLRCVSFWYSRKMWLWLMHFIVVRYRTHPYSAISLGVFLIFILKYWGKREINQLLIYRNKWFFEPYGFNFGNWYSVNKTNLAFFRLILFWPLPHSASSTLQTINHLLLVFNNLTHFVCIILAKKEFGLKFLKKYSCHWKGSHISLLLRAESRLHSYWAKSGEGIKKSRKDFYGGGCCPHYFRKGIFSLSTESISYLNKIGSGAIWATKKILRVKNSLYDLDIHWKRRRADYWSGFRLWI